jgi:RNA polymerase sigma factor (sigma-70 family)
MADLLARTRGPLVRFLNRQAGGLARFEDAEDLAQGVQMHALKVADRFEYRSEPEFLGWLYAVARRYIADRNAYWKAMKRNGGTMLRLTFGGGSEAGGGVFAPPAYMTGPQTLAQRREHLEAAARAIAALPERDGRIVTLVEQGLDIEAIAEALGIGYEAAQRARLRAMERFEKLFRLAADPPGA